MFDKKAKNTSSWFFYLLLLLYIVFIGLNHERNGKAAPLFFLIDAIFFYYSLPASLPATQVRKRFNYLFFGFLFSFFLVGIYPSLLVGKFYFGSLYNLTYSYNVPFIRTTIDPPIVSALVIVGAFSHLNFRNNIKRNIISYLPQIFWLAIGILYIFLISRRGPIATMVIAVIILIINKYRLVRWGSLFILPILIMPFFFWELIFRTLQDFGILEEIVKLFAGRKHGDIDSYFTATGRMKTWMQVFLVWDDFSFNHIFYGFDTLDAYFKERKIWGHFHNAFMQLFYDNGLASVVVVVLLLWKNFSNLLSLSKRILSFESKFLWGIFINIYFLTIAESLFSGLFFVHLLFIATLVLTERLNTNWKFHNYA